MTVTYTKNLHLAIPDFLSEPWHAEFAQAMESIDQVIFSALASANTQLWANNHPYAIGNLVIDPDTGGLFSAAVEHTSSAAPVTFASERIAHPTYWTAFALTVASQAEAEAGLDNIKYMSPLRTSQAIDAQVATAGVATQIEAEAGVNNSSIMTPLRVAQSVGVRARTTPQGRLTLMSDAPIMVTAMNGAGTIYYTPYTGTTIPIWDGSTFQIKDFWDQIPADRTDITHNPAVIGVSKINDWFVWTESKAVTLTIGTPCIVTFANHGLAVGHPFQFTTTGTLPAGVVANSIYYVISAGYTANTFQFSATRGGAAVNSSASQEGTHTVETRRLTHGVDWASDTARAASLQRLRGIWVNSTPITNGPGALSGTYVGTTISNTDALFYWRPFSNDQQTTPCLLWVYNAYNRITVRASRQDSLGSYTYLSAVERRSVAAAANTIHWIDGLGESYAHCTFGQLVYHDAGSTAYLRIYLNSGSFNTKLGYTGSYAGYDAPMAEASIFPTLGRREAQAWEWGAGTTALFHGGAHYLLKLDVEL
jgi:hypothetical protein